MPALRAAAMTRLRKRGRRRTARRTRQRKAADIAAVIAAPWAPMRPRRVARIELLKLRVCSLSILWLGYIYAILSMQSACVHARTMIFIP